MMADALTRVLFQKLVTISGDDYENGEVVIDRGRIVDMRSGISEPFSGTTHDKSDCLVLPGFVNAHCHLSLSGLKNKVFQQDRFIDWIESVVTENAALSWADRVSAMHTEAQTLIESGVTALADYFSHPELLVEYQNMPFHHVLFLETLGFQKEAAESKARELETLLQEHPGAGSKMQLALAPHAPYSVSPTLFRELKKLADRMGCRFSCHVAEVAEETRFLRDGSGDLLELLNQRKVYDPSWTPPGVSPVRYLERLGVLRELVAIHLNCIDEEDSDRLAAHNASAVFCPGSTRWFGRKGWMPVRALLDKGIAVGLGTDSLASNDSLNFLNTIRQTEEMLPELHRSDILWLATAGGKQALGMNNIGIDPGREANLIGFRFRNKEEDWWDLPFDPERQQVDFTMVSGEIAFEKSII